MPWFKKRELPFFLMSLTDFIHIIIHTIPLKCRGPFDEYLFPVSMISISKYKLISQMNIQEYSKPYQKYAKHGFKYNIAWLILETLNGRRLEYLISVLNTFRYIWLCLIPFIPHVSCHSKPKMSLSTYPLHKEVH